MKIVFSKTFSNNTGRFKNLECMQGILNNTWAHMNIRSIKDPWHGKNLCSNVFAAMHMISSFKIKMTFKKTFILNQHVALCW